MRPKNTLLSTIAVAALSAVRILSASPILLSTNQTVRLWTGGAGDSLWATSGNWSDGSTPANSDTALFATGLTIAPPSDFAGVVAVSNAAVLQLAVSSDCVFSSAVASNSTLTKTGTGTLTLKALPGYFPGNVIVQEGTVIFAGNGLYEAPGFFGTLTVAGGATAAISDSPADTRHSVLSRGSYRGSAYDTLFTNDYRNAECFCAHWNALANPADRDQVVYDGTNRFLNGTAYWPAYYATNSLDDFEILSRAVFILPAQATYEWMLYDDDYGKLFFSGDNSLYLNCTRSTFFRQLPSGWNALDAAFRENTGGAFFYVNLRGTCLGSTTLFTPDLIWKGVCFAGLNLQESGTLSIAAGQAVAFSALDSFTVRGTVSGPSGAYFSVMAGSCELPSEKLTGFSGTVEVRGFAAVDLGTIPETPSFSVLGNGTITGTSGLTHLASSDFTGIVDIPPGTVLTNSSAFPSNVCFTGDGTLVTKAVENTETVSAFTGTVLAPGGASLNVDTAADLVATNLVLSQNAALVLGNSALIGNFRKPLPDWNTEGCWSLNGTTLHTGYNPGTAYITNGILVLTDDCGAQRRSAFLTNLLVTAGDTWQVAFTYSGSMPGKYANEQPAEGFSFIVQSAGPTNYNPNNGSAAPSGSYGFFLYQWPSGGTQGFKWLLNGAVYEDSVVKEAELGINLLSPIDFTVSYRGNVLTIIMEQSGKSYTLSREISDAFASSTAAKYLGFSGGTGYWGEVGAAAQVCLYQTISNFRGWIQRTAYEYGAAPASAAFLPFSADTWAFNQSACLTNDMQLSLIQNTTNFGTVVCKVPVSSRSAFCLDFDECLDTLYGGWAEGMSVFFQPSGTTVSNARGNYQIQTTGGCSFGHYYWENRFRWFRVSGYVDSSIPNPGGVPKSLGVNHIRLVHDGAGTLTATITRDTATYVTRHSFSEIPAMGDTMYLGFAGAPAGWSAYVATRVKNPEIAFVNNMNPVIQPSVLLQEGVSATVVAGNLTTNTVTPSATFTNVVLGADSTLNLTVTNDTACKVGFARIELSGKATLAAGAGAIAELSTVALLGTSPDALTMTGTWMTENGTLTFQVPAAWVKEGCRFNVADLTGATYAGTGEPAFALIDESGKSLLSKVVTIRTLNGIVSVTVSRGTIFLLL